MKIFITLFSVIVKSRELKFGRDLDSRWMYHVNQNHEATAYLFLHFSCCLIFRLDENSGTFSLVAVKCRGLKIGTLLDSGWMYSVYQNKDAAAYSFLYFFIFLSLQFLDYR